MIFQADPKLFMWCGNPGYIEFDNISFYEDKSEISAHISTTWGYVDRSKDVAYVTPSEEEMTCIFWKIILYLLFWFSASIELTLQILNTVVQIPITECLEALVSSIPWVISMTKQLGVVDEMQNRNVEYMFEAYPWSFLESLAGQEDSDGKARAAADCESNILCRYNILLHIVIYTNLLNDFFFNFFLIFIPFSVF